MFIIDKLRFSLRYIAFIMFYALLYLLLLTFYVKPFISPTVEGYGGVMMVFAHVGVDVFLCAHVYLFVLLAKYLVNYLRGFI